MNRDLRTLLALLFLLGLVPPATAQDLAAPAAAQPTAVTHQPKVHLGVSGVGDLVAQRAGFELSATHDVTPYADLGLGASLGESIGLLLLAQFHFDLPSVPLLRPFAQLRGQFHIASKGYGGGAWVGMELKLGHGRFKLGPALIAFAPRAHYHSYAVLGIAGFELDLPSPRGTNTVNAR